MHIKANVTPCEFIEVNGKAHMRYIMPIDLAYLEEGDELDRWYRFTPFGWEYVEHEDSRAFEAEYQKLLKEQV